MWKKPERAKREMVRVGVVEVREGGRGKGEREICILAMRGFDFMPLFISVSRLSLCILFDDLLKEIRASEWLSSEVACHGLS